MRLLVFALACLSVGSTSSTAVRGHLAIAAAMAEKGASKRLSDAQIKKVIIEESIAAYDGNCPCPYSRARNGSRCGKRSAYSREGGAAPLCFPADVTSEMVQAYRDEHPDA